MSKSREAARKIRHYRVRKRLSGQEVRPRLDVFRSYRFIYAMFIDVVDGSTLASAS